MNNVSHIKLIFFGWIPLFRIAFLSSCSKKFHGIFLASRN